MAKPTTIKIKLVSTADTGFYYVAKKNARTMTEKLVKRKYDPVARKHVDFKETKIKQVSAEHHKLNQFQKGRSYFQDRPFFDLGVRLYALRPFSTFKEPP